MWNDKHKDVFFKKKNILIEFMLNKNKIWFMFRYSICPEKKA